MAKQSNYSVGIYVRLSKDDERSGESLSIENQKEILTEYVSRQDNWKLCDIYVDDGFSGTSFNRPEIQRLLDDAKMGKINLIICKDLSRFGRNYIEVEEEQQQHFMNPRILSQIMPKSHMMFLMNVLLLANLEIGE